MKKTEEELEATIDALDNNSEIQALLGRDYGAIAHERNKIEENGQKNIENIWQQVNRFRSVTAEVKKAKPNRRRTQEIQGLIDEVLKQIDESQESCDLEYKKFMEESKEVISLQRDIKDGDKVRGFDLEENMDLDMLVDLSKYKGYIEDAEQAMIDDFYTSCEMLLQKRDLEIQAVEMNDVSFGHSAC